VPHAVVELLQRNAPLQRLHNLRRGPRKSAPFQHARAETERDARTQHLAHLGALPAGVADGGGGAGHDARGLRQVVVAVQPRVDEHAVVAVGQGARQSNPCLHGEDRDIVRSAERTSSSKQSVCVCLLFTTHPIDEAVLAVGRAVAGAAAGEELEQHHAVGEDVRLLRQLPARRVLRGQVPEIDEQFSGTTQDTDRYLLPCALQYYPNVPMTRVDTCVWFTFVSLASPKSATWPDAADRVREPDRTTADRQRN
jgi:hypothetical protein